MSEKPYNLDIKTLKVPYDIDTFWNDGCGGSDWFKDKYGKNVNFVLDSSGAIYICPENPSDLWRIYYNPLGNEVEMQGFPASESFDVGSSFGSPELEDIIDCLRYSGSGSGLWNRIYNGYDHPSENQLSELSSMLRNYEMKFDKYRLEFDALKKIKFSINGGYSLEIEETPPAYFIKIGEVCGGDTMSICAPTKDVALATVNQIKSAIKILQKYYKKSNGIEMYALETAIKMFGQSIQIKKDLNKYETICRDINNDLEEK